MLTRLRARITRLRVQKSNNGNFLVCPLLLPLFQGAVKPNFVFMVVQLLGKDLYKLRNEQRGGHFSISTAVRVGVQTCQAIEELHG